MELNFTQSYAFVTFTLACKQALGEPERSEGGSTPPAPIASLIFAYGCEVTSMSLVGSLMALTHSILVNLFINVELNTFSPTSPAKYCFCPKHFLAYVWLVYQGTREG